MVDYFDTGINILDKKDERRCSYFYNLLLLKNMLFKDPYQSYGEDLKKHGFDRKAYFSSKLKQSIAEESEIGESTSKIYSKSSSNTYK